jgi:cupin fold WbuC family metalloprotein
MKLIGNAEIDNLCQQAKQSPRGRSHLVLHAGHDDPVQRFFVAADQRTYIRPHRHHTNAELAVVLRGAFDLLVFDEDAVVLARHQLGDGANVAYEAPALCWHGLMPRTDGSVFMEVKAGPFIQSTAVEFAPWAPAEADPMVPAFQKWLRQAQPGDRADGAWG